MKRKRPFYLIKLITFLSVIVLTAVGCAKTTLTVLSPAEINTEGIKTVAVGNFEVGVITSRFKSEREGGWISYPVELSDEQKQTISRAVRARVVNLLTTTPYFKVVFSDEFAAIENDAALQQLVSVKGYKTDNVDAVISGKVWLDVTRTDGADINIEDLVYKSPSPVRQTQLDLETQQLVWWPYKSARGTLGLEMKLTRLNPSEVVSVVFDSRNYAHKVGGAPVGILDQIKGGIGAVGSLMSDDVNKQKSKKIETSDRVLPPLDQMVADLALSASASFVKRVAVTEKTVQYPIGSGGDETAKVLIESGAYGMAIEVLQNVTAKEPNPDDLYNLGLCFEASGDYGLALNFYRDAFKQDNANLVYAMGIGRIERLQREFPSLRRQLDKG